MMEVGGTTTSAKAFSSSTRNTTSSANTVSVGVVKLKVLRAGAFKSALKTHLFAIPASTAAIRLFTALWVSCNCLPPCG